MWRATVLRSRTSLRNPSLVLLYACVGRTTYLTLHLVSYSIFLLLFLLYLVVALHLPPRTPSPVLDLVVTDMDNHYI